MKIEKVDKLEKVFKIIEWLIWLGLFAAAITYVYDVYSQYLLKTTNFKMATEHLGEIFLLKCCNASFSPS